MSSYYTSEFKLHKSSGYYIFTISACLSHLSLYSDLFREPQAVNRNQYLAVFCLHIYTHILSGHCMPRRQVIIVEYTLTRRGLFHDNDWFSVRYPLHITSLV